VETPRSLVEAKGSVAVFAGGCFWCVEAVFEQLNGVNDVVSGYAGGDEQDANYREVSAGSTNHAEAVRVDFDPSRITFGQLLKVFFATHDPTQLNRQGPDVGYQYRSAIFYLAQGQKQESEAYITQLSKSGTYKEQIVTTIESLDRFYLAEEYHQDYVQKYPDHPYVTAHAIPKVKKVRKTFKDLLRAPS
jgi:methionine-S-sulfoxide reductase